MTTTLDLCHRGDRKRSLAALDRSLAGVEQIAATDLRAPVDA